MRPYEEGASSSRAFASPFRRSPPPTASSSRCRTPAGWSDALPASSKLRRRPAARRGARALFDRLAPGRWKDTTVVVVGTFGIGFGESGLVADSGTFSDCDLRVPIVVRAADSLAAARGIRVDGLASLVDLAPTLLDLHGIQPPAGCAACPAGAARTARPRPGLFAAGVTNPGSRRSTSATATRGPAGRARAGRVVATRRLLLRRRVDHRADPRQQFAVAGRTRS